LSVTIYSVCWNEKKVTNEWKSYKINSIRRKNEMQIKKQ